MFNNKTYVPKLLYYFLMLKYCLSVKSKYLKVFRIIINGVIFLSSLNLDYPCIKVDCMETS